MPACPFYTLTDVSCPGHGSTRCRHVGDAVLRNRPRPSFTRLAPG
ncbi:DUF2752 domain-containing protein [Xanthomonas hyacinthi]|nr:DUF2752 domain-containing protein [Xanthomonas hyacinthi]QGY76511.1 DUF2752 domain-containing protein [Xanthomonas hyacinthi]